jgi:hypothetical protein
MSKEDPRVESTAALNAARTHRAYTDLVVGKARMTLAALRDQTGDDHFAEKIRATLRDDRGKHDAA